MADPAISTSNVWPYYSAANKASQSTGPNESMGKNEFLKILVAQIGNQDPLQPVGDTEFIAQMAQFSSLEQMMNIAEAMNRLSGSLGLYSSMIGKQISWETITPAGEYEIRSGLVDAIVVRDGKLHAVSGNDLIPIDQIFSVSLAGSPQPDEGGEEDGE